MSEHVPSIQDRKLVESLLNGCLAVLPTDTLYGVCCTASNQDAVARLYSLKKREKKPGTIIAASIDQLVEIGLKARYLKAVEQYWPGSISVVIPCGPELAYLHQGVYSLAVRVSADPAFNALLEKTGALMTSSANHPGKPPASIMSEAQNYFGDQVDVYVDGGDLSQRKPSTVIRVVDDAIEVLREGAVIINESGEIQRHEI